MGEKNEYMVSIVAVAVALLIGLPLFVLSAQSVGTTNNLGVNSNNVNFTTPAFAVTADFTPCGQLNRSVVAIANNTFIYGTGNYTISQGAGADGYLSTRINVTNSLLASRAVYVNCSSYEPYGYITDGGTRTVNGLVVIFGALLIAITALPQSRDWFKNQFS